MRKAFSDWYCPNPDCDSEEMIDGDLIIAAGKCKQCGTEMVNVPDDEDAEAGEGE